MGSGKLKLFSSNASSLFLPLRSFLRRVFTPSGAEGKDLRHLLAISVFIAVLYYLFFPLYYTKDSQSYFDFARLMLGMKEDAYHFRTPGYPLILILTGVPTLNTFRYLLLLQAAMAISVPIFFYKSLLRVTNPKVAFWGALTAMVSLVPYMYMKCVMTEQTYIFLNMLNIWLAANYFSSRKIGYIYASAAVLLTMLMVRPAGSFLYILWFFIFLLAAPKKNALHLTFLLVVIFASNAGWASVRKALLGLSSSALVNTNMIGKTLFSNVYVHGIKIQKENGPSSEKFIDLLDAHLVRDFGSAGQPEAHSPMRPLSSDEYFFERFRGNPKGLSEEIFNSVSLHYYSYLSDTFDRLIGVGEADRLFLKVAIETLRARPQSAVFLVYFSQWNFFSGVTRVFSYAREPGARRFFLIPNLPYEAPGAGRQLKYNESQELFNEWKNSRKLDGIGLKLRWFLSATWRRAVLGLRFIVFLGMLLGGFALLKTRHALFVWLCILTVFYQSLITGIFSFDVLWRFIFQTILIELLVCFCAVPLYLDYLKRRLATSE